MLDLNAGKYAAFVWPAYALSAVVIGAMIADALARARRWRRAVEVLEASAVETVQGETTPMGQAPGPDVAAKPELEA